MKLVIQGILIAAINTNILFAESLPICLVIVSRSEITLEKQLEIFKESFPIVSEVGTNIKLTSIVETNDVIQMNNLNDYWRRLFSWARWGKRNLKRKHCTHIHYLLPPVWEGDIDYGAGAAGATCTTTRNKGRRFSYSVIREQNHNGDSRIDGSIISSAHELLHTLGANHIDSKPNVMRSYYSPDPLARRVLPGTKKQIRYCRQGLSPLGN